jgi:hypothetical protein
MMGLKVGYRLLIGHCPRRACFRYFRRERTELPDTIFEVFRAAIGFMSHGQAHYARSRQSGDCRQFRSVHAPTSLKPLRFAVFCVFVWLAISDAEKQTCYKTGKWIMGISRRLFLPVMFHPCRIATGSEERSATSCNGNVQQ